MMNRSVTAFLSALFAFCAVVLSAQTAQPARTAEEILGRVDANMSFRSIRYTGRMEITVAGQTRYKTMRAVAQGSSKAFVEFTNPEDKGVRYLKLDKKLWIYFPREQDTVRISGHLLKEGMMGSDVSYEDALESSDFLARYTASLKEDDSVDGRRCFVVQLVARVPTAAYDRLVLWIDTERFLALKQEMYAKSGRLLKVSNALEVLQVDGRWFASRVEFVSRLRANTRTVFAMSAVELDVPIDEKQFSMAALTK